ncbi:hypothetical protein [Sphaerisporangium corydalis]|uniref:Uncharacterized protein n=1 Tax=Sphaerisporangium corydalis TaxID=1441875 RepID=A0ABV9EH34_9ACTN|nr:hypothetical protein [Sphaerisporangium corydalis]
MSLSLIEEGAKKSSVLWVSLSGRDRLAWHVWHDGAIYLVTGGEEQSLPGLADASSVRVTLRSKDNGAELISFTAAVTVVDQSAEAEAPVIALLAKDRLNAVNSPELTSRWSTTSAIIRLTPTPPD